MFGHGKGALTGATHDKQGMFEAAHGGTLFLDELGDLPSPCSPNSSALFDSREIRPISTNTPKKISCRVIAATNRDLEAMMAAGKFREDLYYRLSMVELHCRPDRADGSFPYLVRAFLERYAAEYGKPLQGLTPAPRRSSPATRGPATSANSKTSSAAPP
jgi:transcriptional regulator with GAF, ATPase, and Fis domain